MNSPTPCAFCGALPCDQARPSLDDAISAAITLLYTHSIITDCERNMARRRLSKLAEANNA